MEAEDLLRVPAGPAMRIEWYAEALGPGAAVLATRGDRDAPNALTTPSAPSNDDGLWIALGIAGGVAVAAAVVILIAVLATQPSPNTHVSTPTVRF